MNRIEMRNYYRSCTGYLSLMNAILVFVVSCLAIYIADFDELDVDEGTGVVMLNLLYVVFTVGTIFAIMILIAGIIAAKGNGEGIFGFCRFNSVITMLLMILAVVTAIYVQRNEDVQWTSERSVIVIVYLVTGIIALLLALTTFLFAYNGKLYYDGSYRLAKDVPDGIEASRPVQVEFGIQLFCATLLQIAIAFLSLYFSKMIEYFDKTMVENNELFSTMYRILFVAGLVIAVLSLIVSGLNWFVKGKDFRTWNRMTVFENGCYLVLFTVVSAIAMARDFVKSQSPDVSYIIFAFILCICSLLYLVFAGKKQRKKSEGAVALRN